MWRRVGGVVAAVVCSSALWCPVYGITPDEVAEKAADYVAETYVLDPLQVWPGAAPNVPCYSEGAKLHNRKTMLASQQVGLTYSYGKKMTVSTFQDVNANYFMGAGCYKALWDAKQCNNQACSGSGCCIKCTNPGYIMGCDCSGFIWNIWDLPGNAGNVTQLIDTHLTKRVNSSGGWDYSKLQDLVDVLALGGDHIILFAGWVDTGQSRMFVFQESGGHDRAVFQTNEALSFWVNYGLKPYHGKQFAGTPVSTQVSAVRTVGGGVRIEFGNWDEADDGAGVWVRLGSQSEDVSQTRMIGFARVQHQNTRPEYWVEIDGGESGEGSVVWLRPERREEWSGPFAIDGYFDGTSPAVAMVTPCPVQAGGPAILRFLPGTAFEGDVARVAVYDVVGRRVGSFESIVREVENGVLGVEASFSKMRSGIYFIEARLAKRTTAFRFRMAVVGSSVGS